jgi:hypothetical protein
MNEFLIFVLIYALFAIVGPLIRKAQKANRTVTPSLQKQKKAGRATQRPSTPKVEDKLGQYFGKLEDALRQKQVPSSASSRILPKEPAFKESVPPEIPPKEPVPARRLIEEEPSFVELELIPESSEQTTASLLGFDKRRGYMQGIVLAEILGPPVSSKRRRRKM